MNQSFLIPDWPVPSKIRAAVTYRSGGVSLPPFDTLNLAHHVGDSPEAVAQNRAWVVEQLRLPAEPFWLDQVHGTTAVCLEENSRRCEADASFTQLPGRVCAVMTADCLPVLFTDRAGSAVGVAHAGWRGLLHGILEKTAGQISDTPGNLLAWLGPAIGPDAFEVGDEVRDAFLAVDPRAAEAFRPSPEGRWLADIYLLARQRLEPRGIRVFGGGYCTYSQRDRFFSYRRDGRTGRMASLIWIEE